MSWCGLPDARSVVVVITTRNEAETIGGLVLGLRDRGVGRVVVTDADSHDRTATIAAMAGAEVVRIGRAPIAAGILAGWRRVVGWPWVRVVVTMDAGGSHDPRELPRLLEAIEHGADVAIGSRFAPGASYVGRPWRRVLSRLAGAACALGSGWALRDWTSGYRAMRRELLGVLLARPTVARHHGWQIEVLARLLRCGARVVEVPITYRAGRSSFGVAAAREAAAVWWREVASPWR